MIWGSFSHILSYSILNFGRTHSVCCMSKSRNRNAEFMLSECIAHEKLSNCFLKWQYHFIFPLVMYKILNYFASLAVLSVKKKTVDILMG